MKTTSRTEAYAFNNAPRCGARTKGNHGLPCRCPAVKGKKRCRVHSGAKGAGGQLGNANALKHGYATTAAKTFRAELRHILRQSHALLQTCN